MRDGVANRLDKTVDQCGGQVGASSRLNASGRQKPVLQRLQEFGLPLFLLLRGLELDERARNTLIDFKDGLLGALAVFFEKHFFADLLRRKCQGWLGSLGCFL